MDLETIDLGFKDGFFPNHTLALIQTESEMYTYPGGKWYPIFTGCFSLGAQERYQVFTSDSAGKNPTINATMIPWALKDDGATTSSSFGLHYGSASPFAKVPGSLLYGGYDRNRVTGSILDFQGTFSQSITLQDISIDVIKGSSPFESIPSSSSDSSTITGLLAKGNSTITPSGLSLYIDPCSPYLTLPQSTCDAIASHLPVIYDASLGLYLWNTSSPRYKLIVASASALSFTFMGGRNTDSATIHIPFRHLNLTLTAPFTDGPTPYFPCFTGGTGEYVLGRAFLQDAFLGANWERSKFFLAQAPGPNIPAGVDPVSIQPDEETIKSGGNNWERSWEGFWSVLTPEDLEEPGKVDVGTNGTITSTSNDGAGNEKTGGEKPGLSTGAMVGIAVGAAVLGMALVGAVRIRILKGDFVEGLFQQHGAEVEAREIKERKRAPRVAPWAEGFDVGEYPALPLIPSTAPCPDVAAPAVFDEDMLPIDPRLEQQVGHQSAPDQQAFASLAVSTPKAVAVPTAPAPASVTTAPAAPMTMAQQERRIAELHQEVQKLDRTTHTWDESEDELLILLRNRLAGRLTYAQISAQYLLRHSEKGCESRRSWLKLQKGM
ncbi:hypothetical protein N0V88_005975 [Collariella sp. IMI 366227]|nr:hypothetical protein N0V88_005975 [Collariella sp. IMI 366227]